jgi:hypothetical protein
MPSASFDAWLADWNGAQEVARNVTHSAQPTAQAALPEAC